MARLLQTSENKAFATFELLRLFLTLGPVFRALSYGQSFGGWLSRAWLHFSVCLCHGLWAAVPSREGPAVQGLESEA